MSLGKKTLALFLALGFCICAGGYSALRIAVLPAFEDFEHQSAKQGLLRARGALDAELRAMALMNTEYSAWDDTYEYAMGSRPEYAKENLGNSYWLGVDIDMVTVFDADGKLLYSWMSNPVDGTELPANDIISNLLEPGHPLVTHESIDSSVIGLLKTSIGTMQVTSYPVLTTEGAGPIAGTFLSGQLLTEERVKILGQRSTVDLSLHSIGAGGVPLYVDSVLKNTDPSVDNTATAIIGNSMHAFELLHDIVGEPAAILETIQPQTVSEIGQNSIRTTMALLAIGSIGFMLAALLFMQHLIVTPIKGLTEKILDIRHTGNLETEIGIERSDEVGILAEEFNQLATSLNTAKQDLEGARDDALSMSRAKSEFLARMSHEIRTPMNGVLGMTELLGNTALDEKQKRFARTIYESAESLLHIINDILDVSKIESGKVELDIAPFNLRSLVEECLELLADSAHRKNLELVGVIPPGTHTLVEGDALRLRQILINLLGNAVKFTDQGEIVAKVIELHSDDESIDFRIEVQDSGIGIKPENMEKIFEPFSQEDGSTSRRYGGTGLGLSICSQLVELMGGEIGVESISGDGCTMWFTLSLKKDLTEPQLMQQDVLSGKHVLIVDDSSTNRETLRHQLENWEMSVEEAESGAVALERLSEHARGESGFDVVLLDMNMPGMDGVELATAIRELDWAAAVPLVMLSSVSGADIGDGRSVAGINAWLTKPVRQARLYDALVSHLARASSKVGQLKDNDEPFIEAINDETGRSLRVLLAEDNQVNQMVAIGMLNELGHETTAVDDGSEAVAALKEQEFDIVLMDCQMPVLDGYKATQQIRQWEAEEDRSPTTIVALTANALTGDRERCLGAGMDDYLSKPMTIEKLAEKIAENSAGPEQTGSKGHILIVDDNAINQRVTEAIATELGYSSSVVSDGDEALHAMQSTEFDLVLMDCHMPVRDGYDTTREIRRLEDEASSERRIPIVALTADLMQSNRKRCLNCGMDDYVTKPFTEEQLRIILARWLDDSNADDSPPDIAIDADGFSALTESIALTSIDKLALDEITRLDDTPGKTLVREIVVSYCAVSTKLILQLRSAISDRDAAEIEVLAHSLKGSSGQVGAILLATLCEQLIGDAKNDELGNAEFLCERIAVEHSSVVIALDKELERIAA
jgi:CheY-like chemotaxis protein/HPt (histidine-containing phosphotransfer) domain-containing protein